MISGNTYEEVYTILSYMDKPTVMKIPEAILKNIKENRNQDYKTRIDKNDIFNEENVSKETIDFLCWLDYKYWMNPEQKLEIDKINSGIYKEKDNSDNIFQNNIVKKNVESTNTEIAKVQKRNLIEKIIEKLKKYLINKKKA